MCLGHPFERLSARFYSRYAKILWKELPPVWHALDPFLRSETRQILCLRMLSWECMEGIATIIAWRHIFIELCLDILPRDGITTSWTRNCLLWKHSMQSWCLVCTLRCYYPDLSLIIYVSFQQSVIFLLKLHPRWDLVFMMPSNIHRNCSKWNQALCTVFRRKIFSILRTHLCWRLRLKYVAVLVMFAYFTHALYECMSMNCIMTLLF